MIVFWSIINVRIAVRATPEVFASDVTISLSFAFEEVKNETVHQVWFDETAQLLPFIVTVDVSFPPVPVYFNVSGVALKTGTVTTGVSGVAGSLSLQEVKKIEVNAVKMKRKI